MTKLPENLTAVIKLINKKLIHGDKIEIARRMGDDRKFLPSVSAQLKKPRNGKIIRIIIGHACDIIEEREKKDGEYGKRLG